MNKLSQDKPKITTLNLHDLLPEDEAALKTMKENKNDKLFVFIIFIYFHFSKVVDCTVDRLI